MNINERIFKVERTEALGWWNCCVSWSCWFSMEGMEGMEGMEDFKVFIENLHPSNIKSVSSSWVGNSWLTFYDQQRSR